MTGKLVGAATRKLIRGCTPRRFLLNKGLVYSFLYRNRKFSECSQNQIVFSAQLIGGELEKNRARETGDQSRMEKEVLKKNVSKGRTKISTVGESNLALQRVQPYFDTSTSG